jgi:hypothetical protein
MKKKPNNPTEFQTGHLIYKRQPTAPSIPSVGLNQGYNETHEGQLVPQDTLNVDSTMGPAYYHIQHEDTKTTKKYKGVHFGHLKEKRSEFKGREGPGPGDYHPDVKSESRTKSRRRSGTHSEGGRESPNLPRYHELVSKMEEKKGVPGPGKYQIKSQFSPSAHHYHHHHHHHDHHQQQPSAQMEMYDVQTVPFGTAAKRFPAEKWTAPSPGSYDDPRTAFDSSKRLNGLTKSPFGQTSVRFKEDKRAKQIPGPGSYDDSAATSLANRLDRDAMIDFLGVKTAFGSTSVRTESLVKRDEFNKPGPAHYQSPKRSNSAGGSRPSANFLSTSKRLYEPPPIVTSIPPPGSYEVAESYSGTQGKIHVRQPKDVRAGFNSTSTRNHKPGDILIERPSKDNPGPGEYSIKSDLVKSGKHGEIYSRESRFRGPKSEIPGPGAYSLSVPLRDTLLKGTHNHTLKNPLSKDFMKTSEAVSTKGKKTFVIGV